MKITDKGQVTIPLALRKRFKLLPGTEVDFIAGQQALEIKPRPQARPSRKAFELWLSKAAGSARPGIGTDELMAVTRGED